MKYSMNSPVTGKCVYCGESTSLNIHQECGEKMRKKMKQRKSRKNKKYDGNFLNHLSNLDG